jgi:hypothetical protein
MASPELALGLVQQKIDSGEYLFTTDQAAFIQYLESLALGAAHYF